MPVRTTILEVQARPSAVQSTSTAGTRLEIDDLVLHIPAAQVVMHRQTRSLLFTPTAVLEVGYTQVVSQTAGLGDSVAAELAARSATSESVGFGDTLATEVQQPADLEPVVTDGAGFGDTVTVSLRVAVQATESLAASDTPASEAIFELAVTEAVVTNDTPISEAILGASVAEAFAADDTPTDEIAGASETYDSIVLADNPWLYWRLEETSGTTAVDETGNGRDGTYDSGASLAALGLIAEGGNAVSIATGDTSGQILYTTMYSPGAGSASYEAWVTRDTTGAVHCIFSRGDRSTATGGYTFTFDTNDDLLFFLDDGSSQVVATATGPFTTNTVYHCVGVVDRTSDLLQIWVDGNKLAEEDISAVGSVSPSAENGRVGFYVFSGSPAGFLQGDVDEVAIYDRALTAAEIGEHYNAGIEVTYDSIVLADGPVAYWRLEETSGTTAVDETGNGNDGTYQNVPSFGVPGLIAEGGNAVSFDGVNEHVNTGMTVGAAGSIEFWLDPANGAGTTAETFVGQVDSSGQEQLTLQNFNDGNTYWGFFVGGTEYRVVTTQAFPSNPFHVAFTWEDNSAGGFVRLYWNGELVGEVAFTATMYSMTNSLYLAASNNQGSLISEAEVVMDEVAFYNRALTAAEIQEHHRRGLKGADTLVEDEPFTDTDSTALENHASPSAGTWARFNYAGYDSRTMRIQSNEAYWADTGATGYYLDLGVSTIDYTRIVANVTAGDNNIGFTINYHSTNGNAVHIWLLNNGDIRIDELIDTDPSNRVVKDTLAGVLPSGISTYEFECIRNGGQLAFYVDGSLVGTSEVTFAEPANMGTLVGMRGDGTGSNRVDRLRIWGE